MRPQGAHDSSHEIGAWQVSIPVLAQRDHEFNRSLSKLMSPAWRATKSRKIDQIGDGFRALKPLPSGSPGMHASRQTDVVTSRMARTSLRMATFLIGGKFGCCAPSFSESSPAKSSASPPMLARALGA
jgi:hypothetical protein